MTKYKVEEKAKESTVTLFAEIKIQTEILEKNNEIFVTKGNKQASRRARVATIALGDLYKRYRALTLEATKTK